MDLDEHDARMNGLDDEENDEDEELEQIRRRRLDDDDDEDYDDDGNGAAVGSVPMSPSIAATKGRRSGSSSHVNDDAQPVLDFHTIPIFSQNTVAVVIRNNTSIPTHFQFTVMKYFSTTPPEWDSRQAGASRASSVSGR